METISLIFILLIAFQAKHFVADYILQNKYMLGKFKDTGWEAPLMAHVGVHVAFTALIGILCGVAPLMVFAACLIDFAVHFAVDRWKVLLSKPYTTQDAPFWYWLGADQMMHHLTHYGIIAIFVFL